MFEAIRPTTSDAQRRLPSGLGAEQASPEHQQSPQLNRPSASAGGAASAQAGAGAANQVSTHRARVDAAEQSTRPSTLPRYLQGAQAGRNGSQPSTGVPGAQAGPGSPGVQAMQGAVGPVGTASGAGGASGAPVIAGSEQARLSPGPASPSTDAPVAATSQASGEAAGSRASLQPAAPAAGAVASAPQPAVADSAAAQRAGAESSQGPAVATPVQSTTGTADNLRPMPAPGANHAPASGTTPRDTPSAKGGGQATPGGQGSAKDGAQLNPTGSAKGGDQAGVPGKDGASLSAKDGAATGNASAGGAAGASAQGSAQAQAPRDAQNPAIATEAKAAGDQAGGAPGAAGAAGAAGGESMASGGAGGAAGATSAASAAPNTASGGEGGEAASGAAGEESAGPAQAVQEKTEDKMAAADPQAAAYEAHAQPEATDGGGAGVATEAAAQAGAGEGGGGAAAGSEPSAAATSGAEASAGAGGGTGGQAEADSGDEASPDVAAAGAEARAGDSAAGAGAGASASASASASAGAGAGAGADRAMSAEVGATADPEALQRQQAGTEARELHQDERRVAEAGSDEHAQEQAEQQSESSAGASAPAEAEMSGAEKGAGLSDLGESVGGGGGEGGGGGAAGGGGAGGGASAATEQAPAPDTSAQDPAAGLGAAATLGPVQAGAALGGVGSAIDRTAGEEAGALQEQMPQAEVGGDGSGVGTAQSLDDSGGGAGAEGGERPAAVDGGGSEATPEPAPLPAAGPAPTEGIATPSVSAGEGGKVDAESASRVQGAVDDLPTQDPGLDVPAGAPPQVQLNGDADPATAAQQKAELDRCAAGQRAQGAADAAAPAGENAIRVTRPREVVKGPGVTAGGATGAGAAAGSASGASDEALAIVANEKKGPEVRAAMAKARAEMAGKKGEHQAKVSDEKGRSAEQLAALKQDNQAEHEAEKAGARSEVAKARGDWTAEQRKVLADTHSKAGKEVAKGNEKVAHEQSRADSEAERHISDGERQASDEKARAERDAAAKKAEAKQESGGVFGWLSSKVSSFFNAIKNGITAIFDAAKKLVRAVIEKAKKLAVAVIEAARKAIVSIIKAVGAALIALGDVLLAAFPGLKKRFRSFIESKVKAAENAVNRLADALKMGVTRLLDALGKAFEFLLDAYKKAMFMVLDAAKAVVDGAIKFAKAAAELLGTFVVLIKDIASNPGGWVSNLGAAVMDGVKNHLWKSFKSAIKGWFDSKLDEVLGVGTTIWNVLKKGGIAIKDVGQMAFEALKAAIPAALIQLLIEKVVAMIVPAAGAVLAIIEGLQAAWGTVQRLIAALGKFVAFLKAIKSGGAGPQFAELLASAAIVVIDFVANWLLKKLRGPTGKVGSKVKAIAGKIMAKIKAAMKKVGGALKKVAKKIGGVFRKGAKKVGDWRVRWKARRDLKKQAKGADKADRSADKQRQKDAAGKDKERRRQDKARRRTLAALKLLISLKAPSSVITKSVAALKRLYKWGTLELQSAGNDIFKVVGGFSPVTELVHFSEGFTIAVGPPRLTQEQRKIASSNWKIWQEAVAMKHVDEVVAPNLAAQGLTPTTQTMLHHPGDKKVKNQPEAVFTDPSKGDADQTEVTLVEATLNATWFATNAKGGRHATGQHKIIQMPQTLFIALSKWPKAKIKYLVICSQQPGETTRAFIQNELTAMAPGRVHLTWLVLG